MKDIYTYTATTVSFIRYHFVFCPYRRRKIFLIPGVEERFKELVRQACAGHGMEILAMECHVDHVYIFLSAPPKWGPADVMRIIKGASSNAIRNEFPALSAMRSLWTRSYLVSTAENVSADTIQRYVQTQKTRS